MNPPLPGICHIFTPENSRQNKAQPLLDMPQNCVKSLGNSKPKNKDPWPWKFHIIFSWSPFGNSTSFLINPSKFRMLFLWYPLKFHILNPSACLDFFYNSPMLIESQQESHQTHNLRNLLFVRRVGSLTGNRSFMKFTWNIMMNNVLILQPAGWMCCAGTLAS